MRLRAEAIGVITLAWAQPERSLRDARLAWAPADLAAACGGTRS